jgi:AraC family transcriptional regulator of adaptative response/methylated-DNA-[protein]-cysteine methyltransferase
MHFTDSINYKRIEQTIQYIMENFRNQPSLEELAERVNLSPFHFQRLFSEWAGTTPKKFLRYISIEYSKKLLREESATIFDTSFMAGLSGTGRLHDLFISIEGMTPSEYKHGGSNLNINFSFSETPFGNIIVASTGKGVCHLSFNDNRTDAVGELKMKFPNARFEEKSDLMQERAIGFFKRDNSNKEQIKLHLKGTDFQLKVWEALLKIPEGKLVTYGEVSAKTGNERAARATGSAIGANPVAYLIPCHRVIRASGVIGEYLWGSARKFAIIGREAAIRENK